MTRNKLFQNLNNITNINIVNSHHNFSTTNILYGKDNTLSRDDRSIISTYEKAYVAKNPVPKLLEENKINLEKAVDIAAAFKNNSEGLEQRKKDILARFEEVQDNYYGEYFTTKNEELVEHLNKIRVQQGKTPISSTRASNYMDSVRVDSDKVQSNTLHNEFEVYGFLPSSLVRLLKDSLKKHDKAKDYTPDYIFTKGKANNIDKELFKKPFNVLSSISDEESSSSNDSNTENSSLKRPVEGESSQENKRVRISDLLNNTSKKGSGQDPYTAYSIEPHFEKSRFFLLLELLLLEDLGIILLAPIIIIVLFLYGIFYVYKRFTKKN